MFIAKISAITACIGIAAGFCAVLYYTKDPAQRLQLAITAFLAGSACIGWYFLSMPQEIWSEWWRVNIEDQASQRILTDPVAWVFKFPALLHFLCFTPIFAVYAFALPIAAQQSKNFIHMLFIITTCILLLDIFLGGDIRRNLFGLSMLSILSGFVCTEFFQNGVSIPAHPRSWKIIFALSFVGFFMWGALANLWAGMSNASVIYISASLIFLVLMATTLFCSHKKQVRYGLMICTAILSLLPMFFQSLFAPYTRIEGVAALEQVTDPQGLILSSTIAWIYPELKRRMVITNCTQRGPMGIRNVQYTNDVDTVPKQQAMYYVPISKADEECAPKDIKQYQPIGIYQLFSPENPIGWLKADTRCLFVQRFMLLGKEADARH
jgi:hypothetical protein